MMKLENVRRLMEFDTPTVANGVELLQYRDPSGGFMGPDVRALTPEMGVRVGIAVTARMDTTSPGTDKPGSLFLDWLELMDRAAQGDGTGRWPVIGVMESVGPRVIHTVTIGDGMGTGMKLAGCTGFVTNGSIRDIEGVRAVPMPSWGYGLAPMHGRLRWLDVNSPVCIDGITVRPGDLIHADVNGVIVIPPEIVDQVADKAQQVRDNEAKMFARLRQPGFTFEDYMRSRRG
jgi:4-hydroxy-4-methyl-2-oxoglutarate aldolase